MKRALVLGMVFSLLAPMNAMAQNAAPSASAATAAVTADTPQTAWGVKFTVPKEWSEQRSDSLIVVSAPESDARLVLVNVGQAANAKDALIKAWQHYQPAFARKLVLMSAAPAREGWDEISSAQYLTSPDEHRIVQAVALRKGNVWTALLVDGSIATFEKRGAATELVLASLQPAGHVRETFIGRTAHRLTPARVKALLSFVQTSMRTLHVPGVGIALVDHGKVVYQGGLGVRTLGKPQPIDENTLFMIASNTKGMTTLMLARLVDQGKLRWDEPVTQAYPSFRLGSPATTAKVRIEDLVCACTGVPRKDFDWLFGTTPQTGPSETFVQLAHTEPTSKYGEVFQYSNTMASAAGYIAGHLEYPRLPLGVAYDQAMQTLIFDPLGMTRTTFDMNKAQAEDHASPYSQTIDGVTRIVTSPINRDVLPYAPAGAAWSSPHDLIQYVQDELTQGVLPNGKRLVSAKNLLQRRVHTVPVSRDVWYGMGLMDDRTYGVSVIHHGGDLIGYHSDIIAIPSANVGAVFLTNSTSGAELRGPFLRRLLELLYDGKPEAAADVAAEAKTDAAAIAAERKLITVPAAAAAAAQLASYYTNPSLGHIAVRRDAQGLIFDFGMWSSHVASRTNTDGTISFITIDPGVDGFDFVMAKKDGIRELTTRDGQHAYTYLASRLR
ncbi:MAG TPA: serine hydrolase domain-containing protein [Candidatus Baltobacteraceae bacterium]|nr:serine hydrolase domain-containing protein [Candidatus Baltobacteraceae bacterium]